MARPSRIRAERARLLPIVARAFAELGYRRTTTAELARRCRVRENILYRLWEDKRAMFIASIGHVYDRSRSVWDELIDPEADRTVAERLLEHESEHLGEFGLHRIVFAGLSETDDPEIRRALSSMYRRFHRFMTREIAAHREIRGKATAPDAGLAAWGIIGLGTVATVIRELGLLGGRGRKRLLADVGRRLLEGTDGSDAGR